jgi:hypothetical protein
MLEKFKRLLRTLAFSFDAIIGLVFGLFSENRFFTLLRKIKFYKKISNFLYEKSWNDLLDFFQFAQDGDYIFNKTESRDSDYCLERSVELDNHPFCKGLVLSCFIGHTYSQGIKFLEVKILDNDKEVVFLDDTYFVFFDGKFDTSNEKGSLSFLTTQKIFGFFDENMELKIASNF